ncbi:MAG: hypothetical protein B7Z66_15685 [Chromatiales bacterium 21-64-14]|nr:MAG: hypothetical protein B7Z66_15685 [Chromatiales bacterium 21-64-14]
MDAGELRRRLLLPETRSLRIDGSRRQACADALADDPRFHVVMSSRDDCSERSGGLDRFFLASTSSSSSAVWIEVVFCDEEGYPGGCCEQSLGERRKAIVFSRKQASPAAASATKSKCKAKAKKDSSSVDPASELCARLFHAAAAWDCWDPALGSLADEYSRLLLLQSGYRPK